MKRCGLCKQEKTLEDFYLQRSAADKRQGRCKTCQDNYWKLDKTRKYEYNIKKKFGISFIDYQALLEKQEGVCAICGRAPSENKRLCVDHNHKTDEIRGLLCFECNTGIGKLQESVDLLRKAIHYLDGGK